MAKKKAVKITAAARQAVNDAARGGATATELVIKFAGDPAALAYIDSLISSGVGPAPSGAAFSPTLPTAGCKI